MPCRSPFSTAALVCLFAAAGVWADSRPGVPHRDVKLLSPEAAGRYADTTLFPRATKWLTIPWLLDLKDAISAAKAELLSKQ